MAKVVFVQDIAYEYFGVMYMGAFLKQHGHDCDVFIESLEDDFYGALERSNADMFAFSILTGSFKWAIGIAGELKKRFGKPIIFGGVHVYTNPENTIEQEPVDMVCTGEGEMSLKLLCDSLDEGTVDTSIEGLWFKTETGIVQNPRPKMEDDLDKFPFPDRMLYWKYPTIESRTTFPIMGSRGCPYKCTYCFIPTAKELFAGLGKFVRQRSPENILAEIDYCIGLSPCKESVHFVEDHFGNNRPRTLKILRGLSKMKNGKLSWLGAIRIERFMEEDYVIALSQTNHGLLGLAVECGNEQYRNEVLQRETKNADIIKAADLATKYGIKFTTLNMVGLPGESFEQALETLELNLRIKPVFANCYIYYPYPNTKLQQYAVEHNLMTEGIVNELGFSWYDRYRKDDPDFQKMINLQRVFAIIVGFPRLKKPLLKLVRMNATKMLDGVFGVYYMLWLHKYYNLTWTQIRQYLVLWAKNSFKRDKSPVNISISKGKGQFYTSKMKGGNEKDAPRIEVNRELKY